MASQRSRPGLIDAARRRDSSTALARSSVSVRSACIVSPRRPDSVALRFLLAARRAIPAVLGLASDEVVKEPVALVAQLLVDTDLRGVVAANRRLLRHDEELLERRPRRALVAADVAQDRVCLAG